MITNANDGLIELLYYYDLDIAEATVSELASETRIRDIQGTGLRSPLERTLVSNVAGIVTAVASNGFYLQDPNPDDNPQTSEGIFVFTGSRNLGIDGLNITVGASVQVSGQVQESQPGGTNTLSVTRIGADRDTNIIEVGTSGNPLPKAILIGSAGRVPPTEIIASADFPEIPLDSGIGFYESLEGMLVTVQDAITVSPTSNFSNNSEIWVVSNLGADATGINSRGGIGIAPDDFNPERIQIDDGLLRFATTGALPQVDVGYTFGDVTGVINYAFSNYEVLATAPVNATSGGLQREVTNLIGTADRLTIASYNVENLNPTAGTRFDVLAGQIINNLKAPDIIGLQEIQDNNGPIDDGTVAADLTYQALIDAIADAGGLTYEFLNIDPVNNRDGGQAGGNIRVGYLYNPDRVSFVEGSLRRITDPNATPTDDAAFSASRKPLVATFEFNGQEVTVINNHLTSRGGRGTPLFGNVQPPIIGGDPERTAQAVVLNSEINSILADDPNANVVVLGDLNGFDFEQFQEILSGDGEVLTNLSRTLDVRDRATFNFQGNSQALDHVLVTNNLANDAQYDIVHVNVDFAEQPADHEPLVASLNLPKPPKNIVLSLDGLTFRFVEAYLENGQLDANTGLGYLINKGVFVPSTVTTPSNTAPVHIAITTGSTAAHNNINNNSFHLIRSPFNDNIRGFGAPIGGYDPFHPDGAHESDELTAEPLWVKLREAGKTVVAATFSGADGATVTLPGSNPPIVIQSNDIRTVDYTVPFGTGGGIGARGFGLSEADFAEDSTQATTNLSNLGIAFYGNVKVADLERISGIAGSVQEDLDQEEGLVREDLNNLTTISGGSTRNYDLKVAAIDTTDDNLVNYDQLIVYDANAGITINNAPPSTGSAFLGLGQKIAPFFLEGSNNVVGVSYLLTQLDQDLSTVHLIRTSANHIPRPANNPAAIASIDNTNNNVGFWRPQPDLNIARGTAQGLSGFSEIELEGAYATLNEAFSQYQTDIFLNAIYQTSDADLALGYLEGPDGVSHNFLLTDPRQATDRSNPNSILEGQDSDKVARYQDLVLNAYKVASDRVQQVIDYVGVDANGVPNSNIIITSDHGFAPFHTSVNINNILTNAGFDRSEVRAVTGSSSVNIYINLQGREPDGTVSLSRYKALQQQIVDTLQGLFDTNPNYVSGNAPIIDNVFKRQVPDNATVEDVIKASSDFIGQDTGDVFAQLSLGYTFNGFQTNVPRKDDSPPSQGERAILSVPTFYGDHGYDSNLPEMKATFIAAGPDFNPTTLDNLTEIRSIDIAPTILDILDVQPADTVDGESIFTQPFTLQILQTSDQEAGIPAFRDIIGFSAVMNALDGQYANTLKLTTGDVYISSPFFNASRDIYDNTNTPTGVPAPLGDQGGIADILINNELGWDVASVGNHEFSGGAGSFLNLVAPNPNWVNGQNGGVGIGAGGYPGAAFPYLANNLDYSNANLPNGLTVVANGGAPLPNTLTGSVVKDVNGEKVGIIGIVTPYLKSIADTGLIEVTTKDANGNVITGTTSVDVQVDSIIRNITPEVQALTNAGINKIILMTHLQESRIEIALAEKMAALGLGVDLLLGGGSHQLMTTETGVPPLREDETQQNNGQLLQPFPQVYGDGDNKVVFVNSAANYRYLNQLVVTFDYKGVVSTIGDDSGPYATDIAGVDRLYGESITTLDQVKAKADPDIVDIVDGVQSFVNKQDGNIFGQTDVFLNGVRGDVRTQETNLGNLTADAQDFYAEAYLNEHNLLPGFNKIDISFTNGGSIRDHIGQFQVEQLAAFNLTTLPPQANPEVGKEEGDVSQLDIANSLRFDGDLVVGTVTATGFLQLAEHMISSVETGNGRFGQISGFNFSYDPTAPTGQRIRSLALADETGNSVQTIVEDGKLVIASNTVFSVVTQGFLANGGDSYPTVIQNITPLVDFAKPDSLRNKDLRPGRIQDAFAEYLLAFYNNDNGQQPFAQADTPQSEDQRIQSFDFRQDTVLEGITPLPTTVNGTLGDDIFDAAARDGQQFIGNNQILSTGSGNDTVDVRYAVGDNNIRTAAGNDTVYAGTNNRIDTGAGDDLLFLGTAGGNNIVTGGAGKDQFSITENDALLPANPNIIADYKANQGDLIGFVATSLTWGSLGTDWNYSQAGANTIIEAFGQDVAILNGVNASTLTQANFVFA